MVGVQVLKGGAIAAHGEHNECIMSKYNQLVPPSDVQSRWECLRLKYENVESFEIQYCTTTS